jgi:RimJ/RimL family protein N-acetyltransferase
MAMAAIIGYARGGRQPINGARARHREGGAHVLEGLCPQRYHDAVALVPELRGDSILLNAHTDEDVAAHVAGEDEETARRFGWWPKRSTAETVRAAYADWARNWHDDGPRRTFAAREPESGALVGGCELQIRPDGSGEVAYWTNAGKRGRGYATEALLLLVDYAASIGVPRLEAHIAPDNHASRRVAQSAGFALAGSFMDDGTEMIRYVAEFATMPGARLAP